MQTDQLLLIDLSSLAHPLFHMSASEPDPNWTSTQVVARVRALAADHPYAAVCCDAGRSFRHDLAPRVSLGDGKYSGYKADRPERDARLYHQIDLAAEQLRRDGFPVWRVEGFEADDIIASAARQALAINETTVLIATADKDLLQLVSPRVQIKNVAPNSNGAIRDEAAVQAKFGVTPTQMLDYLCMVGDASDNIVGAKGIGGVTAAKLLKAHGSIDAIYAAMDKGVVKELTPALRSSMVEFRDRWPLVASLIRLRDDVEIPFSEIAAERTAPPMEEDVPMVEQDETERELNQSESSQALGAALTQAKSHVETHKATGTGNTGTWQAAEPQLDAVGRQVAVLPSPYPGHVEFSQQLEPRSMNEAVQLAQRMYDSRLFSAYGTPQAVLATVLAGRELGIPAMASLRAMHIIDGKPQLSADTLAALVMKSGKAKYFRCTERSATRATFATQRLPVEDYPEQSLTFTIEEAKAAWRKDQKAWDASGWGKTPTAMLVARAKSALARLEYPDVVGNLYGFEEMD